MSVRNRCRRTLTICCALLAVLSPASLLAQTPSADARAAAVPWTTVGDEAIDLLQRYLRLETINPPGNEILGARFFARLFAAEGIEYEVFESLPGRANIVARLRGDGSRGGSIVLLNHMDVVPADALFWSVDPFGGEIVGDRIYGRGVTDMKADAIVQFLAIAALRRAGIPLGRDIVFMGTAGEETGGMEGAGYIIDQRPDLVDGVQYVLTEGGGGRRIGGRPVYAIETTQKTPLWLRLSARGVAGHGSQAIQDSAANRLIRALDRVRTYRPQLRLTASVADMIRAQAVLTEDPDMNAALEDIENSIGDPVVLEAVQARFGNLLRSTIAITVLEGSSKTNVISPSAFAELDCRLLPGEDVDLFIATLQEVIDDDSIEVETILRFAPSESPRDTALWRAIETVVQQDDAESVVIPSVIAGFTDSHYFRERGIVAYGWSPLMLSGDDGPPHGVDERLSVRSVRNAPRVLFDVLRALGAISATS